MLWLWLLACTTATLGDPTSSGCGDGVLATWEACDDGDANSDTGADACRSDCSLPRCGDGVTDADEACDDGNALGGDGCTPACALEDDSGVDYGTLDTGTEDCTTVPLEDCEAVLATLAPPCPVPAVLQLHDPEGALVGVSSLDTDGCAVLDPVDVPGARSVDAGDWQVCVTPESQAVPAYALSIEVLAAGEGDYPLGDDLDEDALEDRCDPDIDGDGIDNDDDGCPEVANAGEEVVLTPDDAGFFRHWLVAGPFEGNSSDDSCLPTSVDLVADDDASAVPELATAAGTQVWTYVEATSSRVDLEALATVDAPREAYLAIYVVSDGDQTLTLGHGPDDGALVWLNGEIVQEISGCQGTVVDRYQEEVTLLDGVNTLMVKVYDQGGGWGTYLRFLDADGEPVIDSLTLSPDPSGTWAPDDSDADGDGVPDVCDPEPL